MADKIKIGGELDPRTPEKILGDASTIKDRTWANTHSDVAQTPNQKQDEINEYLQEQIDNIVATEQGGIQTDASPAEGSVKLVQSGGTYTAIKSAETTAKTFSTGETVPNIGITSTPTNDTDKLVTSKGVKDAIENIAFSTNEKVDNVGIDSEPIAGSDNLVKSGGIAQEIYKINQNIVEFPYERVDGYYLNQIGYPSVKASASYFVYSLPNALKTIRLKGTAIGGGTSSIVFTTVNDFSKTILKNYTFTGNVDEVLEVPEGTKYILIDRFDDTEVLKLSEPVYNDDIIRSLVIEVDNIKSELESTQEITYSEGGFIDTDGIIHTAPVTSWAHTGYLGITPNDMVNASSTGIPGTSLLVAFYNNNKEFISGVAPTLNEQIENITAVAPENAVYVIFCSRIRNISSAPSGNIVKSNFVTEQDLQNTEERLQDSIDDVYEDINLYRNNLHKPFVFNNKTAAFFGDSVTYGVSSDANGIHNPSADWDVLDCYRKVLCKKANLIGTTYAVSGSFICDLEDAESSILNKVKDNITINSNYDFIFIAGGINDFWTRKPLGQLGDSSYNTFYGALEDMCNHLDSVLSGKTTEVIFLTPINYSHTRDIGAGESLNTYRNAIFEIATIHGYNVIDTSVIGFPNKKELDLYKQTMIYDGVHPTITGHRMMGENLYSILL